MADVPPLEVPEWDELAPWEEAEQPPANGTTPPKPDLDVDAFLAEDEPEYDWVIPGLVERGDRIILTGPEGGGKSTLLRQIAIQAGCGRHPFTGEEMAPVSVMLLDLENSKRQVRRKLRPLRLAAGDELNADKVRIRVVAQGIDLLSVVYQEFLDRRLEANRPDLLICGPLYKLSGGDPTEERPAKAVALFLDEMRAKYDVAVLMEAHVPHASGGQRRPERPYGASLWMRWPEFGIYLSREGHLNHWRGARDERDWPSALQRGGEWPWMPTARGPAMTFGRILEECRRVARPLSERELADLLEAPKTTVHRAIEANRAQWDELCEELTA